MPELFFMVLADNSNVTNVRHSTIDRAKAEASRLAGLNKGTKFYVLASLGHMVKPDPVIWEAHGDGIPF